MQKGTRIAALGLIGLAALLLVVALSMGLRKPKPAANAGATTGRGEIAVVVAAHELSAGVPLIASDLKVVPLAALPHGGYSKPGVLVGKVATSAVAAGTPLTRALLAEGLALSLQAGERAVAIPVDEVAGAGNRIEPGDYVDVFLSLKKDNSSATGRDEGNNSQSRLLLSRLRILSYGARDLDQAAAEAEAEAKAASQELTEADAKADESKASNSGRSSGRNGKNSAETDKTVPAKARSAVLAVPIEEANKLLLGAQSGKLALALRNPSDPGQPDENLFQQPKNVLALRTDLTSDLRETSSLPENTAFAGISGDGLAGRDSAKPAPAKTAPAPRRVPTRATGSSLEIIRGGSSSSP